MTIEAALEQVVDQAAALLHGRIGLRPEQALRSRLRRCVQDEANHYAVEPAEYLKLVAGEEETLQRLVNRVTVQETAFFRHPEHFAALADHVLPGRTAPVIIWSAGCANGQEAYTLAMVLEEQQIAGSVIATDLSTAALLRTTAGRYSAREVSGLSPGRLARHFTATGDTFTINHAVRRRVVVVRHNLLDPLPTEVRACQVAFCRNVLIYFTPAHARAFLDRLADALPTGGYLFLGSAETVWPISDRFDTLPLGNTFLYRSRASVPVEPPAPSRPSSPTGAGRPAGPPAQNRRPRAGPTQVTDVSPPVPPVESGRLIGAQVRTGRQALEAGQVDAAIVAFRKWAFLDPDDAMAYLHLALALEAAGDRASAHHAYGAARRALLAGGPSAVEHKIGGYAADELMRLLDAKSLATEQ